jgi:starch-binding outer membrane protein, SusD/RagB family
MKKKISFITLFSMIMFSCEDFLNKSPQDSLTVDSFYNTGDDAVAAVNAAYDGFQHMNYYSFNYPMILNILGGDARKGGFGSGDRAEYLEFESFNTTADNVRIKEFFDQAWGGVNRANSVLQNVGKMEVRPSVGFTEALKTRVLGEAKFLRGLHYYNLVQAFGGMPIYEEVPSINSKSKPRATDAETWAFVIKNFQEAAAQLPDTYDAANQGRASKGAANAMLARIYAMRAEWAEAKKYITLVKSSPAAYDLLADYGSIFDNRGNNSRESIFEIQYSLSNTSLNIWNASGDWNSNFGAKYWSPQTNNAGWGFMQPTQELVDAYETGDIRLPATVFRAGDTYGNTTFNPANGTHLANAGPFGLRKGTGTDFTNAAGNGFDYNYKIIRFGEILLLEAEVENELNGPSAAALTPLNRIRQRARLKEIAPAGLTKESLRDIILKERRVELAYEGVRFHDLVRRNLADRTFAARGYRAEDRYLPIPASEINLTGWEQNK